MRCETSAQYRPAHCIAAPFSLVEEKEEESSGGLRRNSFLRRGGSSASKSATSTLRRFGGRRRCWSISFEYADGSRIRGSQGRVICSNLNQPLLLPLHSRSSPTLKIPLLPLQSSSSTAVTTPPPLPTACFPPPLQPSHVLRLLARCSQAFVQQAATGAARRSLRQLRSDAEPHTFRCCFFALCVAERSVACCCAGRRILCEHCGRSDHVFSVAAPKR
jgi:hypothetical protein